MRTTRPRVSVEPHGRGWRVCYRVNGDRKRYMLPTEEQARFAADLIEGALARRPDLDPWSIVRPLVAEHAGALDTPQPKAVPVDLRRSLTLREYYAEWIETKKPPVCRVSGLRDYKKHFATYLLPEFGDTPLAKISEDQIVALRDRLLKVGGKKGEPLNVQTVRNIMSSLKRLFRDAMKAKMVAAFPFGESFRDWDLPRTARFTSQATPFEGEEKIKLLAYLRGDYRKRRPHYAAYVIFQLYIPCRPSEASGLQWGDVDLTSATPKVHIQRSFSCGAYDLTKTALSDRWAVLHHPVVEELVRIKPLGAQPETPVFLNQKGQPIDPHNFDYEWYRLLDAAKVRLRKLYSCKDTAVTHLRRSSASWAFIEQQSGVRESTLRRHYQGQLPNELIDEYDKLASWDESVKAAIQPHPIQPQQKEGRKVS